MNLVKLLSISIGLFTILQLCGATSDSNGKEQEVYRRISQRAKQSQARNYTRCELIHELESLHDIVPERGAIWTCLAINEPNARESKPTIENPLAQNQIRLRDIYPCKAAQIIEPCFTNCYELRKLNDVEFLDCLRKIYDNERRISGNGFNHWSSYDSSCSGKSQEYTKGCGSDAVPSNDKKTTADASAKIYEPCELARELRDVHKFDLSEIGIWVCMSELAGYNTSHLDVADASGNRDHGILRINDAWWCGKNGVGGICNVECSKLRDNDIGDDFACGRIIFRETMAKSGDGFTGKMKKKNIFNKETNCF